MLGTASATVTASLLLLLLLASSSSSRHQAQAADTPSPNSPIEKPDCDANTTVSVRYSSSSARLYLESEDGATRGGCVTLRAIWEELDGSAPVYAVDPDSGAVSDTVTGTWLLSESLYVEDGITLKVSREAVTGYSSPTVVVGEAYIYLYVQQLSQAAKYVIVIVFADGCRLLLRLL